jgi:hypothetical protein
MACCAAAIFIICQIAYAIRRMLSLITGGMIPAVSMEAVGGNAAARWTLEGGAASVAQTRRVRAGVARIIGAGAGIAIFGAFWMVTKPDAPGPLAGVRPMAEVHYLICGTALSEAERVAMKQALLSRLPRSYSGQEARR